ncbi:hypothetical protein ACEWY4_019849 [Coilia grayii]|uniref:C2H2-type domain-containing protein n=1 Tax=Coilia grayii TaxID=363190 RepID=A0ABD1JC48_9TELE
MASQMTPGHPQIEPEGSNVCEIPTLSTGDSKEELREENKPRECVLKVTRKLGQPPNNNSGSERQPVALESRTSKQKPPLDLLKSRHSKNHELQADSSDLRRYSRACKEKKDGQAQDEVSRLKCKHTNTTKPQSQSKKPYRSGRIKPVPSQQTMVRRQLAGSSKLREESPEVPSNVLDSSALDVKSPKHVLLRSVKTPERDNQIKTRKISNEGDEQATPLNQSGSQHKLITRSGRTEKLKAQQKLTSSRKAKKKGVRGKLLLRAKLIRSATSSASMGTPKPVKPEQNSVDFNVKPEKVECSIACHSKTVKEDDSRVPQCEVEFKKPRKIDKRSKRYRRMKAEAILNVEKALASVGDACGLEKEDEKSGDISSMSCDESADKAVSCVKDDSRSVVERKPNALTASSPKRKRRKKRSWMQCKRKVQAAPLKKQNIKKESSSIERITKTPPVSLISQPHLDSDKTEVAVDFEDVLQDHIKSLATTYPKQVIESEVADCKVFSVKTQSENKIGVSEKKSDVASGSMVQSDGEMELDDLSMEVSQPLSPTSPDISTPPNMDKADVASLKTPVVADIDVIAESTMLRSPEPNKYPTRKRVAQTPSRMDTIEHMKSDRQPSRGGRRRRGGAPMKCEFCGRVFIHLSAYTIHLRIHTGEKPHVCHKCGRGFAQMSNLNAHMRVHDKARRPQCCGILFASYSSYRKHCKTHREPDPRQDVKPRRSYNDTPSIEKAEKPCPCPICGKHFRFQSTLTTHMRVHSGEKPFSCRVCGKSFSQATTVRVHERIHWSVKPYLCLCCGRGFSQKGTLKVHVCKGKSDASTSVAVAYRCHLCHRCFKDKQQYELHLQSHTDTQRYVCDFCGEKFSLQSELNIHHGYCSQMKPVVPEYYCRPLPPSSPLYSVSISPSPSPSPSSPESPLPRLSVSCPKEKPPIRVQMTSGILKGKPQRGTTQETDTDCKGQLSLLTCPSKLLTSFVDEDSHPEQPAAVNPIIHQLNNLDQKPDPRRYFCPRCGRLFRHVMRLRAHMLTHSQSESYTCGCGKTLASWREFWRHQRVHRQQKGRFFCPTCTQGFRFVSSYREHLRTHPELNAYTCPLCPLTFANSEGMKAHQRDSHKQTLPYICDDCGKGFSSQRTLDRHSVSHQTVGQKCLDQQAVEERPDVLPYQCVKCDMMFKTVDVLFQHQLCHAVLEDRVAGSTGEGGGQNQLNTDQCSNTTSPRLSGDAKSQTCLTTTTSANLPQLSASLDAVPSQNNQLPSPQTGLEISTPLQKSPLHSSPQPFSDSEPTDGQTAEPTLFRKGKPSMATPHVLEGVPTQEHALVVEKGTDSTCAECGAVFSGVSELFEHYLLHARGDV